MPLFVCWSLLLFYCPRLGMSGRGSGLILAPQRSKNLKDRLVKHKIYTKGKSTTCMFNLEFIIDTYSQFQKIRYVQAARPII